MARAVEKSFCVIATAGRRMFCCSGNNGDECGKNQGCTSALCGNRSFPFPDREEIADHVNGSGDSPADGI